ncbi:MAG: acyl-ACP--UDP-N-acetylglucosamine O-acyltransferase [Planctomycetes bacterium]|nr:acyl-ACP--UDP-N-acetylglucosamine O-acyltransferase [Planctomycetota bacterium]
MAAKIHPTAIIDKDANIADGVEIQPYAVVGPHVTIGEGTTIRSNAQIIGRTVIGKNCDIFPGAVVGGEPQDLKFKGEHTETIIGDGNVIRECVTINRGTGLGGGKTVLGNNNLVMAYVHIAHDCIIGNQVIITNCAQLAGHIKVEDMAIISGMVAVHHFVTIGTMSFLAGLSAVRTDVPPYMIVEGNPARVRKINMEGLRRRGIPQESMDALRKMYKVLYRSEELSRAEAIEEIIKMDIASDPCVTNVIEHFRASENGYQGRALEAFRKDKDVCGTNCKK